MHTLATLILLWAFVAIDPQPGLAFSHREISDSLRLAQVVIFPAEGEPITLAPAAAAEYPQAATDPAGRFECAWASRLQVACQALGAEPAPARVEYWGKFTHYQAFVPGLARAAAAP